MPHRDTLGVTGDRRYASKQPAIKSNDVEDIWNEAVEQAILSVKKRYIENESAWNSVLDRMVGIFETYKRKKKQK